MYFRSAKGGFYLDLLNFLSLTPNFSLLLGYVLLND